MSLFDNSEVQNTDGQCAQRDSPLSTKEASEPNARLDEQQIPPFTIEVPQASQARDSQEEVATDFAQDYHATGFWRYQTRVREFYYSKPIEVSVATLIILNFIVGCTQAQIDPFTKKYKLLWDVCEDFFNIVFFFELCVNLYGSWRKPFFRSNWNRFDLTVVSIGVLSTCQIPLPGPLKLVRLLRAFRVFRLFGRVESLKKTVSMIQRALPGVCSAFMIAVLLLCIYAVLSVDFFKDHYGDCNIYDRSLPLGVTPRGKCFGEDYYGNFLKALYTLFQILTGESWSEMAVRPILVFHESNPFEVAGVSFFFLSFVLINGVVIINVVVAFLIDGMGDPSEKEEDKEEDTKQDDEHVAAIRAEVAAVNEQLDFFSSETRAQLQYIIDALNDKPQTGNI